MTHRVPVGRVGANAAGSLHGFMDHEGTIQRYVRHTIGNLAEAVRARRPRRAPERGD